MNNTRTQYEYRLSASQHTIDGQTYTVYGMSVHTKNESTLSAKPIREIPNISLGMNRVSKLVERCNRLQPSLLHLDDIIEDALP